MQTFKQKSPRTLRREQERKLRKQYKNPVVIPANESFSRIKPDLIQMGWIFDDDFGNLVDLNGSSSLTFSPALRLVTEKFNVTIIPHKEGIEISRLEVWEKYQGQGYASLFLNNLLWFLMKKRVKDIYVLPLPAGISKSKNSLAFDAQALQGFYQKRGFQKISNERYWKLESNCNIDITKLDVEILSKLTSSVGVVSRGIEIHFEFVNNEKKNFVFLCPYSKEEDLIMFLERYILITASEIKNYAVSTVSTYFVKHFLNAYKKDESTDEQCFRLQEMFGCFMAEAAREEEEFRPAMEVLGTATIAVLHLQLEGAKNGVKAYRFKFDEQNENMLTSTSTVYSFMMNQN
jgi:GNAT superfamily N-acetyltransferase